MEKSPNCDSTPQEWSVFRLLVIKLYSRISISAKTCWSATNAPRIPETLFGTDAPVHFDHKESIGWSPRLRRDFWNFPHYQTACYEVREQKRAAICQACLSTTFSLVEPLARAAHTAAAEVG